MKFHVVCETPGCENRDVAFNVIIFDEPISDSVIESLYEAYGHGWEEEEDYCPLCKELGILYDFPEESPSGD
jgi:hypothetical protein